MATTPPTPRVGVAVIICNAKGELVIGKRAGSHGAGSWAFPGGHLEMGESFFTCAERETLEETALRVKGVKIVAVTNDVFDAALKHYATIFVQCVLEDADAEPRTMEPNKCEATGGGAGVGTARGLVDLAGKMSSLIEKPAPSKGRGRLAFLKTKRAIAILTILVVVSVVLIVINTYTSALGATHELSPHNSKSISSEDNIGDSLGSGNGSSNGSSSDGSTSGGQQNSTSGGGNGNGTNEDSGDDEPKNGNPPKQPSLWRPKNSSSIADGTPLRIMCLGASIIRGEVSTDNNGFRKTFRGDLANLGAPINMVGSQRNGDMPDNDMEAYGGNRVSQIHDHAKKIVPKQVPNVFIINVGTNNVLQYKDTDVAGVHMEAFIDYLLKASPRATVVLSTLLTNTVPNREPLILDINRQFRELYQKYENKAVVLAELHYSEGLPGRPTAEDISDDGSHPTDKGYEIMGHLLADAVKEADERGFLRWPENGLAYDGDKGRIDATVAKTTEIPAPKPTDSASGTSSDGKAVENSDATATVSTTDSVTSGK
ncbi:hypothetical protein E0Z10_g5489 [Xylaria hypoxylon]|uniref:Nudix hydrolase domain-containing protein n=1 Tax=Xylaria hypoxylon TaxID=37992 RepID=A0A4Z0YG11_9PEZI|nr:hypothetical protein E0Z10_g5489 [Xylaria hypoxylon]